MAVAEQLKKVLAFQEKYPTKADKEKALKKMDDEEIIELINSCGTQAGKGFYYSFLKDKAKFENKRHS